LVICHFPFLIFHLVTRARVRLGVLGNHNNQGQRLREMENDK